MQGNSSFRIAALQMVSRKQVADNLSEAERLIADAARQGARLVALPEYFPLIHEDDTTKLHIREDDAAGPIQDFLSEAARKHGVWLIGGTIPMRAGNPDKVRNACLVYAPDGERVARYDKIHLFGYSTRDERYEEANTIEAGDQVVTFAAPPGRIGVAVCYDLRFPELFRAMGDVALIVVPSAFTVSTGLAHWELLLRTRAVENQCYVLAPAQGGTHESGRRTYGDSLIVDPWGTIANRLGKGPGVVLADLEPRVLEDTRAKLPALRHRTL